jgi:hypothetical protein
MKQRIALMVTVALVMAAMLVFAVPAFAQQSGPNCVSGLANPESGFGNTEPGQAGDVNRTFAEAFQSDFGDAKSDEAQQSGACEYAGEPGPPGPFDPS